MLAARLTQANLVNKIDFDNKMIEKLSQIKQNFISSKKLNGLTTKEYNFAFGRIYSTSNDWSKNKFVSQQTLHIQFDRI